ncbi:MAG: DUF6478 family protein [Pseudomonadota bacterium]
MSDGDRPSLGRGTGPSLGARAFAWFWRRRAARARDPIPVLREVDARRRALDRIAQRLERQAARRAPAPKFADEDGEEIVWRLRPEAFKHRIEPGWIANPRSGAYFGAALSIHHDADAEASGLLIAQRPRPVNGGGPRFDVFFESYEFDGAYVSLTLETHSEPRRPTPSERLVFAADVTARSPVRAFIRLTLRGRDGTEVMYGDAMLGDGPAEVAFDLAFAPFALTQEDDFWVDLIFDRPRMTEFAVSDMSLRLETGG